MSYTRIRQARRAANLTQFEVGEPLGLTVVQVSKLERGELPLDAATERRILTVIRRLDQLNEKTTRAKKALTADVRSATAD